MNYYILLKTSDFNQIFGAFNTPETTPSLDYDSLNNVPILNYFNDDYGHSDPIICMMLKKMVKL